MVSNMGGSLLSEIYNKSLDEVLDILVEEGIINDNGFTYLVSY